MNYLEIFRRLIRVVHKVLSSGGGYYLFCFLSSSSGGVSARVLSEWGVCLV